MNDVFEHLKLIQTVISRMAQTSFIIKGWSLTLSIAIIGWTASTSQGWIGLIGIIPILIFWGLDAYYLLQERLFRELYKEVLKPDNNITPFTMETKPYENKNTSWFSTLKRPTIIYLYVTVLVMMIVVSIVVLFSANGSKNGT